MTVTGTTDEGTGAEAGARAGPAQGGRRPDGPDQYTIGEVAALTGLSVHTLRWYERIGLMPHIDRSHTGQRRYGDRDLDWLALVAKLRLTGMPVADMVRYAEMVRGGDHTRADRFELLRATRGDVVARIAELRGTLAVLDQKISFYADARARPGVGEAPMSTGIHGTSDRITTAALGVGGPEVGVQGLGCMGMSFAYGPADEDVSRATLERALELGVTLYDTADSYGAGDNERFLSPFFKAHRDEIVVATKFALSIPPDEPARRIIRNDVPYIRQAVEASLERLDIDTIDLYYMHRRDVNVPIEETVGVMAELVREGKVRQLGLSEVTAGELRAAHAVHPIAAVQSEWSLFSRDIEVNVVPAARELGVTLVPYSPLGRGFLTGSFVDAGQDLSADDFRRLMPRFTGENAAANAALLAPVRTVAGAHGATPGQIALAWVQQRAAVHGLPVVPIPGTRKPSRVEENTAATRITLTDEELARLDPIAAEVAGTRYADMAFTSAGRE